MNRLNLFLLLLLTWPHVSCAQTNSSEFDEFTASENETPRSEPADTSTPGSRQSRKTVTISPGIDSLDAVFRTAASGPGKLADGSTVILKAGEHVVTHPYQEVGLSSVRVIGEEGALIKASPDVPATAKTLFDFREFVDFRLQGVMIDGGFRFGKLLRFGGGRRLTISDVKLRHATRHALDFDMKNVHIENLDSRYHYWILPGEYSTGVFGLAGRKDCHSMVTKSGKNIRIVDYTAGFFSGDGFQGEDGPWADVDIDGFQCHDGPMPLEIAKSFVAAQKTLPAYAEFAREMDTPDAIASLLIRWGEEAIDTKGGGPERRELHCRNFSFSGFRLPQENYKKPVSDAVVLKQTARVVLEDGKISDSTIAARVRGVAAGRSTAIEFRNVDFEDCDLVFRMENNLGDPKKVGAAGQSSILVEDCRFKNFREFALFYPKSAAGWDRAIAGQLFNFKRCTVIGQPLPPLLKTLNKKYGPADQNRQEE